MLVGGRDGIAYCLDLDLRVGDGGAADQSDEGIFHCLALDLWVGAEDQGDEGVVHCLALDLWVGHNVPCHEADAATTAVDGNLRPQCEAQR